MTPQSFERSNTIKSMQYDTIGSLGRHAKTASDVHIDFPAGENSAPDPAILREDARREARRCILLADGRTFTLDLDELPRPEPEADAR
ncbi:hypothetical protein [Streptomyces hayashii]|uniref:hypothetical protein n=1 Tax=Streptomyces hayashii TaxID=2839966 RepID=UPI00403C1510